MSKRQHSIFYRGDIIRTNPEKGFYGIAVVLDDGERMEISPGRWSYPMCHIAVTPLIFQFEVDIDDIDMSALKPMMFFTYFGQAEKKIPWREKLCIDIYTTRNKPNLPIIGKIDPILVYDSPLPFIVSENGFHLCGDVDSFLGREAYVKWCRERGQLRCGN